MKVQVKRLKELNQNRIGVVIAEHPYIEELLQALERNLLSEQKIEVLGKLPPGEQDLRSLIQKIKNRTDIDVLGVFLFGGQISSFYRQLQTLKVTT